MQYQSNSTCCGPSSYQNGWCYTGCGQTMPIVPGSNPALNYWNGQNFVYADGSAQNPISLPFLKTTQGGATYFIGADNNGNWSYYNPSDATNANNLEVTATGSTTARTLANRFAEVVNVLDFGAVGDGVTDDTAAIQAAINAASGKTVIIPSGTYIVNQLNGISAVAIVGDSSGSTTLKRKNNSPSRSILDFTGKNDFQIIDIKFDGNKASQTIGSNNLVISNCYSWEVIGCSFINSFALSGYGAGLVVASGQNDTLIYRSKIQDCFFENNDSDGIYINKEWYLDIIGNFIKNNGGGGINVLNYVFPPVADVSNYLIINSNTCVSNNRSGIYVSGYIQGGTETNPIYGVDVPASREVIVSNNNCKKNALYGIAYQGTNGLVSGNNCEENGSVTGAGGGFLFNANLSVLTSNTGTFNKNYGIDCGGCFNSLTSNNSIVLSEGTGINCGGGAYNIVSENSVVSQGTNQTSCIAVFGMEGDGVTPFEQITQGTRVSENLLRVNNNVNSGGIFCSRLPNALIIQNNVVTSPDPYRAYILNCSNYKINNNEIISAQFFA